MQKRNKYYVCAVLDLCGGFYVSPKGYPYFKVRVQKNDLLKAKIIYSCFEFLKKYGISYSQYILENEFEYHILNKGNIERLVKFVRQNNILLALRSLEIAKQGYKEKLKLRKYNTKEYNI